MSNDNTDAFRFFKSISQFPFLIHVHYCWRSCICCDRYVHLVKDSKTMLLALFVIYYIIFISPISLAQIFCTGSVIIEKLLKVEAAFAGTQSQLSDAALKHPLAPQQQPQYVAYHIRRGDFQQKHTRWEAQRIVDMTMYVCHTLLRYIAYACN